MTAKPRRPPRLSRGNEAASNVITWFFVISYNNNAKPTLILICNRSSYYMLRLTSRCNFDSVSEVIYLPRVTQKRVYYIRL